MSIFCKNCGTVVKEGNKFCTNCGTKIEVRNFTENISDDEKKTENEFKTYDKLGGWLIFFSILLILGNLSMFQISEYYSNEFLTAIKNIYLSGNEKIAQTFHYILYSELISMFLLLLFTISFYTKSNITRNVAILFFIAKFIITPFQIIGLSNIYSEINQSSGSEIGKMIGSLIWALIFLLYFIFSKRVKGTFTKERNNGLDITLSAIIPIILFFTYTSNINEIIEKNKTAQIKTENNINSNNLNSINNKIEQELKNESTYSPKIQNNDTVSNNTNVKKSDVVSNNENTTISKIDTNNVKNKWKYKDWEIENIDDNYIKAFTVGKYRADVFTIIKNKNDCNPSFLYTTTHLFDKSIQINKGDILKMDIKVDNELFNSDTPIYEISDLGFVKQLISNPYPLYESFIEKLKKGNIIQTTVYSPILKEVDITPNEEYSLNGFTKTYNVLNEACRDISALNRYKEVDKNTINQYVSTNNDKLSLIESIECDGKRVKLMSNDEYYLNKGLLLLDNGKSIRLQDMNIDGDIRSRLECKKVNEKSHLIITSTMGNSWEGHYSFNLDTLEANLLDNATEIKLGLVEKPVTETTKIIINKKSYTVPKHPYNFAENNGFINFKDLLGTDYETFLWNLQVGSSIEDVGQYYVGSGNGKSSGGMEEAIFTIDKFTGKTSVSVLTTDFNSRKKNFKYFGEITPPIDKWAKDLQKTE